MCTNCGECKNKDKETQSCQSKVDQKVITVHTQSQEKKDTERMKSEFYKTDHLQDTNS